MSEKTFHIVQQFEFLGKTKKVISGRSIPMRNAADAIARAERDSVKYAGVVALSTTVDDETGEVLEDPTILFRAGAVTSEFADSSAF